MSGRTTRRTATILLMAKAPVPGRVKTRLCPPCSPTEAAALACAALQDTVAVVRTTRYPLVVALDSDGSAGRPRAREVGWLPPDVPIVRQRGAGLADRLANAVATIDGPVVVIGMDTPQLTGDLLRRADAGLAETDAVLGLAADGGWWALGLRHPRDVFRGVTMSTPTTGTVQHQRLVAAGLTVTPLPVLRDVDRIEDAHAVAATAPHTRFAQTLVQLAPVTAAVPA